jgi:hypothetical protein
MWRYGGFRTLEAQSPFDTNEATPLSGDDLHTHLVCWGCAGGGLRCPLRWGGQQKAGRSDQVIGMGGRMPDGMIRPDRPVLVGMRA